MTTVFVKKCALIATVLSFGLLGASTVTAGFLPGTVAVTPGNAVFPGDASGANPGTLVATMSSPFSFSTTGGTTSGSIVSAVYNNGGTLDFYYQVVSNSSSVSDLSSESDSNFLNFTTWVGFRTDGSTLVGAGFQDATDIPVTADSSPNGSDIGFSFFPPNAAPPEIGPGMVSSVLVISTNATGWSAGSVFITDGGAGATVAAFEPVTTAPSLVLTPTSLTFSYQSGGSQPASQTVAVTSSVPSSPLSFTASASSFSSNWLSVSPLNGTTPQTLTVSVNATGLAVGAYSGSIAINIAGTVNGVSVPVSLNVTQACAPFPSGFVPFSSVYSITSPDELGDVLVVGQMSLANYAQVNNIPLPSFPNQQFCGLVNLAPSVFAQAYVPTAAEKSGDFSEFGGLLLDPTTGQPFPGGIIPASRLPDPWAWRASTVTTAPPSLAPTPASMTFNYQPGGSQPPSQTLTIASSVPSSALSFTASVGTTTEGNWLSISPTTGTTSASLTVSVNTAGLPPNIYFDVITITSTGAPNSPLIVPVTLVVAQTAAPTIISLSPASAIAGGPAFTLTVNGSNFVDCSAACLGINWQPASGSPTFISGRANAAGTQLTATITAGLIGTPGTANVSVQAAGGASNSSPFTINRPPPTITSLSPASATAGGAAFTLTVNGTNFVDCSAAPCLGINWEAGTPSPIFISGQANAAGTQLTATITTGLIGTAGIANVSVQAAGGTSNSLPFTINGLGPTITNLSPASATAGGPPFTLTVSGFGFIQCATACLGVNWQPSTGGSTFISGQANAAGTQLTATIPAALTTAAGTASLTVKAASGTSNSVPFIVAGTTTTTTGGQIIGTNHLLFPNVGLNALQEFDPVNRVVVNTISLPAPFTYSGSAVIETVRIRTSDGGILTNAYANGNSTVVALSNSGQFVAAEQLPSGLLQELAFDPLDSTQSTVLAGNPPSPNVIAVDPYSSTQSARISLEGAGYTGLAIDSVSRVYAGDPATGQILRYLPNGTPDGTQGSLFADVLQATGSSEIDALAIDSDNNVYAAQGGSNRIAKFDSGGNFLNFLTDSGFNQNAYVYFNPNDGLLYAGNQADDALTILTTAGTPVAVVHMGGKTVGVPDLVAGAPAAIQAEMETTLTGLTFQTPQGGSAPPPQSFALVNNNTSAALSFTTKVSTTSGGSWLSVSAGNSSVAAGQVSAPITVSVDPSALAQGDYYGLIEIDAAGVTNSPQFVSVVLNILAATANPGPSVTPTGMIFTAVVNGANPAVQSVALSDVLSRSTSFTAHG